MKKAFFYFLIALSTLIIMPNEAKALTGTNKTEFPVDPATRQNIAERLKELKISERPRVRDENNKPKEAREIAKELRGILIGISISFLLLVIVILLLLMMV